MSCFEVLPVYLNVYRSPGMLLRYLDLPVTTTIKPEDCPALLSEADELERTGKTPEAEDIYRSLISRQSVPPPFKHIAAERLSAILLRAGNSSKAQMVIHTVQRLFPHPGGGEDVFHRIGKPLGCSDDNQSQNRRSGRMASANTAATRNSARG